MLPWSEEQKEAIRALVDAIMEGRRKKAAELKQQQLDQERSVTHGHHD